MTLIYDTLCITQTTLHCLTRQYFTDEFIISVQTLNKRTFLRSLYYIYVGYIMLVRYSLESKFFV
jgi:hypothetical protein